MSAVPSIVEAFRRLQAGDAAGALAIAQRVSAADPRNARARLAAGIALRGLGKHSEARAAFEEASRLDPTDFAAPYELGLLLDLGGVHDAALAHFERAANLRPSFAAAQFAAGARRLQRRDWAAAAERFGAVAAHDPSNAEAHYGHAQALLGGGRLDEAAAALGRAVDIDPGHVAALRLLGQVAVRRGDFDAAADRFTAAMALDPADEALPQFLAQAALLAGRWREGWSAYSRRVTRHAYAAEREAAGRPYHVPAPREVAGHSILVRAEQGLGDILFFLRFAQLLGNPGPLAFVGDARLLSILSRTGLFHEIASDARVLRERYSLEVLSADLPVLAEGEDPCPPTLRAAPDASRMAHWRERLARLGPPPYTGLTWRAGAEGSEKNRGYHKAVPLEALGLALRASPGTLVAIQRAPRPEEFGLAERAFGRTVHDLSAMNDDLEEALALVAVLDRHIGVSNTNLHLAAMAGKSAEVLVPYPPEWRWGLEERSAWFPEFRIHRQAGGGDWSGALAGLARER